MIVIPPECGFDEVAGERLLGDAAPVEEESLELGPVKVE
jgi:hypothetical protein